MKVTENITPALKKMGYAVKQSDKQLIKIASQVRNDIMKRTLSGKDVNERTFKPYAPMTVEIRKKAGRPTSKVNLSFYHHMLPMMKTSKVSYGAEISFPDEAERGKARRHNFGKGRLPKREFFGLSKKNINYVEKEIDKFIGKSMK